MEASQIQKVPHHAYFPHKPLKQAIKVQWRDEIFLAMYPRESFPANHSRHTLIQKWLDHEIVATWSNQWMAHVEMYNVQYMYMYLYMYAHIAWKDHNKRI